MKKKKSLKEQVYEIIKEHWNGYITLDQIKQTNITFNIHSYRDQYYFVAGGVTSPYTMRKFVQLFKEGYKMEESHGTLYFKDDKGSIQ